MTQTFEIDTARSESSGTVGRSHTVAHDVTITLDASRRPQPDGFTNSEAFLGSVSSCGVTMIEGYAEEQGIALQKTRVRIEGRRAPGIARYLEIHMAFEFTGVSETVADDLLGYYQRTCPLYGTLLMAAKVTVERRVIDSGH